MKNACLKLLLTFSLAASVMGDAFYERLPVDYEGTEEINEIVDLQKKINQGLKLEHDVKHGYLKSVLKALGISKHSQVLVFSKTSLHRKLINPRSPRALYFNKNSYIGWVEGAKVLEIGVADKNLGAVFYTLSQRKSDKLEFKRDDSCLSCHASSRTKNEPGFFIRSVFPDSDGEPIARAGEDRVNHTTELSKRWGGWYVTANKLGFTHRGNGITEETKDSFKILPRQAKTTSDLKDFFRPGNYISTTSDIQALMTLEHQVEVHNILTSTKFRVMHALHNEKVINEALGEKGRRDITKRIISNAANEILDGLLFVEESSLKNTIIEGIPSFKADFEASKPSVGKASLFQLDFKSRISKYPCSWVIYSDSFSGLPGALKETVISRLKNILTDENLPDKYIHLRKTRSEIHNILTKSLPCYK